MALLSLIVFIFTPITVWAASKPSAPQFSLKLVDNSYDVPSSTATDSYTGVTTTKPGYRVNNITIEVTIKNQPFTPYTDTQGYNIDLYYSVECKGHFGNENEWRVCYVNRGFEYDQGCYVQSKSSYTILAFNIVTDYPGHTANYPSGSQLDFRVEAFTGHLTPPTQGEHTVGIHNPYVVRDETIGYSGIQTITVTYGSSSSTPSQTATLPSLSVTSDDANQSQLPDQTQPPSSIFTNPLFLLVAGTLLGCVVIVVVLTILKKHLNPKPDNKNKKHTP
ncbi:MAG: hypothetical protein FWC30_00095 [Candidatus Bathyarchaeota archaeon]|nr:hypothetical protein [Candidatus Termiticorpusculum sp.]